MFKNCEEIDIISTQLIGNIHNQKIEKYKDAWNRPIGRHWYKQFI